jgi:hypothetical protein
MADKNHFSSGKALQALVFAAAIFTVSLPEAHAQRWYNQSTGPGGGLSTGPGGGLSTGPGGGLSTGPGGGLSTGPGGGLSTGPGGGYQPAPVGGYQPAPEVGDRPDPVADFQQVLAADCRPDQPAELPARLVSRGRSAPMGDGTYNVVTPGQPITTLLPLGDGSYTSVR